MVGTGDDIERTLTIADELEQAAQTDATSNTTLALSAEDTSKSQEEIASETTDAQTETPSQDSTSTTTDTSTNTNVSSSSDTSRLQPATSTEESDQDISSENGELSDDPTTWPDDKLVDTPAGRITMGEVREYARIRDEQIADLESRIGGGKSKVAKTNTLSLTANSSNTSFSFYQHWKNGGIYVRLINEGPYSDTFDVMRDGEWYIGYCLDEGLPAPPDGTYSFWAEYDPSDGGFWITVDCAWPEEDQIELPEGQEWTGEGCQRVGEFKIFFGGKYRTQKVSADGSISNVKTYSYAGAKFGVYSSYDNFLADEGLVGTDGNHADFIVTTGEDGYSSFVATSVGEYYIRELEAPPGFKRKTDGWGVDVYVDLTVDEGTGGPTTDTVSDEPIYDPVGIGLQKTKSDGSAYYGKDGNKVKLGGAVYEFAYYDSLFYSKASIPSSATRTWHLQTDSNGLVELKHADTQMVSGYGANSELFLAGGKPFIPFGTLVIKEVAAPDGYKLSSEVFIATMRPANNSDGYEWVFNGADFDSNAIIADEATDTGSLVIKKKSTNTSISHAVSALTSDIFNYTLAGAVFAVYNNAACSGTPIATLKTNANGVTSELKNLAPYGTFYVKEITPPNGFSLPTNTARVKAVVVKPGAQGTTYFEYTDEPVYAPADIEVNKVDADGNTTQGDATLKDAEYTFSFYYGTKSAIGTPTAQWVLKTDDEGRVSLSDADDPARLVSHTGTEWRVGGNLVLPLGTLVVQETKAPVGYYLSEATYTNTLVYDTETATAVWSSEGDFSDTSAIIDQEAPKKFGISLYKEIQGVENEASLEGIQFEVYLEESDGTETLKDTLTLDETGKAQSAEDAYYLGTYKVYEIEDTLPRDESGNYLIQPYSYTSGTGSNLVATVDQHDDDTYTDMKVIDITCTDYTTETFDSEKKDKDTGKPIADTEFTLHKYTGDIGMDDGAVTLDPATLDARGEYWEEIEVLTTDTHGVVSFENKLYGIYMLVETKANYHYLNASETDRELASADPLDSARIFTIDKNTPATLQTWEDELIQVETTIDKSTIDVTSIGLISKSQSENGVNLTNVGAETYRYDVAFSSGKTNTFADEFWMVDELNMVASPFDLRVTKIYLPTVQNDTAPTVHLLIRTNKSTKDTWDATPVVTKEKEAYHQFSLCDGSSRFVGTGWRYVGEYSSVESTSIDIASLKLAKGEYITGLCLYYGAVEEGFTTVNPLSYDVTATHELLVSTIIPNSAISHISRNWANRNGEDGGLQDDDEDNVVTTVITTFEMKYLYELIGTRTEHIGSLVAKTGDNINVKMLGLLALAAATSAGVLLLRRRKFDANKLGALVAGAVLMLTIAPVGTAFAQDVTSADTLKETRTVQWTNLEDKPDFEKTISVNGVEYTLTGEPSIKEVKTEIGKVPADHSETVECWPDDLTQTLAAQPDTWTIDTAEASGSIPRESITYTAQDARRTFEVNAAQTYTGLPSNDVTQIAKTIIYTNPDTNNTLTLALASISWEVSAYDERGVAKTYTANCIYRGEDTDVVVDHYVVVATWKGEIDSKTPVITYEATLNYEGVPNKLVETETTVTQENGTNWLPVAIGAAAAAAAIGAGVFFWRRRRNVVLCKVSADGTSLEEKARLRATSNAGGLTLVIPSTYSIKDGRWVLLLDKGIAGASFIRVIWCDTRVYEGSARARIEI